MVKIPQDGSDALRQRSEMSLVENRLYQLQPPSSVSYSTKENVTYSLA